MGKNSNSLRSTLQHVLPDLTTSRTYFLHSYEEFLRFANSELVQKYISWGNSENFQVLTATDYDRTFLAQMKWRILPKMGSTIHKIKNLSWIQQLLETSQELYTLVIPALWINKHKQRASAGGGAGCFPEPWKTIKWQINSALEVLHDFH